MDCIHNKGEKGKMETKNKKYRIGVIGGGFVGRATSFGFGSSNSVDFDIKIFDIDPKLSTHSFEETVTGSEFIFICVPTPPRSDFSIDLGIIYKVLEDCKKICDDVEKIFIIKSTVVPGTCRKLSKKYGLSIVSNCEYLTERRANWDFLNASQIVIGSDETALAERVKNLYEQRFTCMKYLLTDTVTSEMLKYTLNCFFTVKVLYMNEVKQICEKINVNWKDLLSGFVSDSRVSDSHIQVPGPDGSLGTSGACFPKDLNAMRHFMREHGVEPKILDAAWKKNVEVRPSVLGDIERLIKKNK